MAALEILLAAVAVIIAAFYLLSLRFHPWWPCWRCRGTGKTRDRIWKRARGTCAACGGKGQRPRLGIRVLNPGRAASMTAAKGAHKRADRRGG
jgi:hypothetical protein